MHVYIVSLYSKLYVVIQTSPRKLFCAKLHVLEFSLGTNDIVRNLQYYIQLRPLRNLMSVSQTSHTLF